MYTCIHIYISVYIYVYTLTCLGLEIWKFPRIRGACLNVAIGGIYCVLLFPYGLNIGITSAGTGLRVYGPLEV